MGGLVTLYLHNRCASYSLTTAWGHCYYGLLPLLLWIAATVAMVAATVAMACCHCCYGVLPPSLPFLTALLPGLLPLLSGLVPWLSQLADTAVSACCLHCHSSLLLLSWCNIIAFLSLLLLLVPIAALLYCHHCWLSLLPWLSQLAAPAVLACCHGWLPVLSRLAAVAVLTPCHGCWQLPDLHSLNLCWTATQVLLLLLGKKHCRC